MGGGATAALCCILALAVHAAAKSAAPSHPPIVFTQAPLRAPLDLLPPEGSRLMLLLPEGTPRPLFPGLHSSADPDVSFDGKRIVFAGQRQAGDKWQIFEAQGDGTGLRQITHENLDCRSPAYQSRIYTITIEDPWYQVTFAGFEGRRSNLYSVKLDGKGLRRLTYNPFGDLDPHQMPDGRILFAGHQPGRLSLFGVNLDGTDFALFSGPEGPAEKRMPCVTTGRVAVFVEGDGALGSVSLRRNLHSYRKLTGAVDGRFYSPSTLAGGGILVARRRAGSYSIIRFDPAIRRSTPVYQDPQHENVQPKAVEPRPEPDGRSSVVDEAEPFGKFYCLSVRNSDLPNCDMGKRLRVVEAFTPKLDTRLLGEFDLDADGSFHIQTPANTPVQFQLLDADGMAIRSCAWVWNKNKEQRGCIGCHEDGESTPENVLADALSHPAVQLTLPPERRRTVTYARDVAPILKTKCERCHPLKPAALVRPGAARLSPLVWSIYGRDTARPWDRVPAPGPIHPMPPPQAPQLTGEEKRTIIEWIDLGARP